MVQKETLVNSFKRSLTLRTFVPVTGRMSLVLDRLIVPFILNTPQEVTLYLKFKTLLDLADGVIAVFAFSVHYDIMRRQVVKIIARGCRPLPNRIVGGFIARSHSCIF